MYIIGIFFIIAAFVCLVVPLGNFFLNLEIASIFIAIGFMFYYFSIERRICPNCGQRGGLYMVQNISYGPVIDGSQSRINDGSERFCHNCERIEEAKREKQEKDIIDLQTELREIQDLNSKTCPHCGKYNSDWNETKIIYQSQTTITGVLYEKYRYTSKCSYCSKNDDRISEWIENKRY